MESWNLIAHDIPQSTYAKLGEILLRWAEADGFLGNSINWAFRYPPESDKAQGVYKLRMIDKLKRLEGCQTYPQGVAVERIQALLCEIREAIKRKKSERDVIAHGTALKSEDGTILLRTDKGFEIQIDIDTRMMRYNTLETSQAWRSS